MPDPNHPRGPAEIKAENIEQLAAKLGRLPAGLSGFRHLAPDQIRLLSDAIDRERARRHSLLSDAVNRALPGPAASAALRALGQWRP